MIDIMTTTLLPTTKYALADIAAVSVNVQQDAVGIPPISSTGQGLFFDYQDNITLVGIGVYVNHNIQFTSPFRIQIGVYPDAVDISNPGTFYAMQNINGDGIMNIPKEGVMYNIKNFFQMGNFNAGAVLTKPYMIGVDILDGNPVSMAYLPAKLDGEKLYCFAALIIEHTMPLRPTV